MTSSSYRTLSDILSYPVAGDRIPPDAVGLKGKHRLVWADCPDCGKYSWRHRMHVSHKCPSCAQLKHTSAEVLSNPKEGDAAYGRDIGKKGKATSKSIYYWRSCPACKEKPRWVHRNSSGRCRKCSRTTGARSTNPNGYVVVSVRRSDPYFPMATKVTGDHGHILEHRLVVAKAIGRCLNPWEIVHHKGSKYPLGSAENKQDNRYPDNLEIVIPKDHEAYTALERRVISLEARVVLLESENAALRSQLGGGIREVPP